MKTIGFPISLKENEKRRALIPSDIDRIKNRNYVYVEEGYGNVLGYSDQDYIDKGVNITSRSEILKKEIICDPKIGDADYLSQLNNQIIYGWVHAVQNPEITEILVKNRLTAFAWEDMFEGGRHVFWKNNEIAGEAAIMHAYLCYGKFPYNTKVAVLGRGNIARGAIKTLTMLGAEVSVYERKTEKLFQKELPMFDVIVNGILWDTKRNDHIIYKEDLKRMRKGAMIIDISCDQNGGIESCVPTTIDNPTYLEEGILHYNVDHTPSLFYKTISVNLSEIVSKSIDLLISGNTNEILKESIIVDNGHIIDKKILDFQNK